MLWGSSPFPGMSPQQQQPGQQLFAPFPADTIQQQIDFQKASSSSQGQVPPGYVLVPSSYLQQTQMMMSQMYAQISALTTAQNALQQSFNILAASQKSSV